MLSTCKSAKSLARINSQLNFVRGQKASTTKLPILLLEDIEKLGDKGRQVDVAHGFARNYLYPRNQAEPVPTRPRDRHKKQAAQEKSTSDHQDLQAVLDVLTRQPIDVQCKASPDGGLLDQIGADEIAVAVKQQLRIELAPQLIQMSQPFTALGQQQAELRVSLPDGSKPTLQVNLTQTGSNP